MTNRDAFMQAIIAAPQDDSPRLICADWLEEQGNPEDTARAEFIRVQIELARLPPGRPVIELRTAEVSKIYVDPNDDPDLLRPPQIVIAGRVDLSVIRGIVPRFQDPAHPTTIGNLWSEFDLFDVMCGSHETAIPCYLRSIEPSYDNAVRATFMSDFRCSPCPIHIKREALEKREYDLLEAVTTFDIGISEALVSLAADGWGGVHAPRVDYRRGFIAGITLTAAQWFAHADVLTASQPIEEVTLTTWPAYEQLMEADPQLIFDGIIGRLFSDVATSALNKRWPEIKFAFSPHVWEMSVREGLRAVGFAPASPRLRLIRLACPASASHSPPMSPAPHPPPH